MPAQLHFGPFRLDVASRRLYRNSKIVPLTPKATELLAFFLHHPGEVLSRELIMEAVWPGVYVDDHALSVQIRDIRKALGDDPKAPAYIETRHRMGYSFLAPVSLSPAARSAHAGEDHSGAAAEMHAHAGPEAAMIAEDARPQTHYARSGDVNLAYQVVGQGPADLIFVMGWVSHMEYFWAEPSFARFLRRLASFSRLILFDKRGTGLSDRVPIGQLPTIEQRMFDLRTVMDAVGSRKSTIVGISEGGPLSAVFAATYPERTAALIMIGTYARRLRDHNYPWGPTAEERDHFINEMQDHWGGPIGLEERAPSVAADPDFRRWWATYLRMGASPGAAAALTRMNAEIDVRGVLPAVRVPTLVMHRTGDRLFNVEEGRYVASLIPDARFVELPGDDHLPFVGDQDSLLSEIEQFLTGVRATADHDRVLAAVLAMDVPDGIVRENGSSLFSQIHNEIRWFRGIPSAAQGGGVLATFDGPEQAVRCAAALIGRVSGLGLPARAGVHIGECEHPRTGRTEGPAFDVAAHIRNAAAAGEVVVSSTICDLVAGSGLRFEARGKIRMEASDYDLRLWTLHR